MNNLTEDVRKVLVSKKGDMEKDLVFRDYEKALKIYKEMVSKGLIIPRGNQMMNTEERYRNNVACTSETRKSSQTLFLHLK